LQDDRGELPVSHVVTAYQPRYYPRLHYLARARQADTFVVLDDVQFRRGSPQHRAPVDHHGETWLTVPVEQEGSYVAIDEAVVDMSDPWVAEHLRLLEKAYGEGVADLRPFYERLCPSIPDPDALWEAATTSSDSSPTLDGASASDERLGDRLDAFRQAEAALRRTPVDGERLRREKNLIADRIGRRKGEDPEADVSALVERSREIDDELAALTERRETRDRRLVAVAEALAGRETTPESARGADEEMPVETLPVEELWNLEGVDPAEVVGEVRLVDLTVPLLGELLRRFEVDSEVVRSSEMAVTHPGDASEYLADLTEALGGDAYLSGAVGYENYLDDAPFERRGLDVLVQDWTPPWDGGNVCALEVLFGADDPGRYVR
jgi:hypothetical protein